ncbi:DUF3231 family protein [Mesobacillus foraminis]|uniref:DUF3231 family protein n=1 Tax=Mesobacillus foraminis TaxID=279826 RepID=UPI00399F0462
MMGILSGNPKDEPLHAGEVYNLWTHLFELKGLLVTMQVLNNHAGDHDLKAFLDQFSESCIKEEAEKVETILKENGIRLPPAPPDRPMVNVDDIPAGARFHDPEISVLVGQMLMAGKLFCSYVMSIAIREDIGEMYDQFHSKRTEYHGKLLKMNKDKGWLVPPPLNTR